MTLEELDAIEARANAATGGPWKISEQLGCEGFIRPREDMPPIVVPGHYNDNLANDLALIAHARADVPALVAEVRRLRELSEP